MTLTLVSFSCMPLVFPFGKRFFLMKSLVRSEIEHTKLAVRVRN